MKQVKGKVFDIQVRTTLSKDGKSWTLRMKHTKGRLTVAHVINGLQKVLHRLVN